MYIINAKLEEVVKEFVFVNSWIETVCENILHKDKDDCKISIFYNYGYFVSKSTGSKPEQYTMLYDERLEHELSKVRVNITVKIDKFMMTNRLIKSLIPDTIKLMVSEITKYKMNLEFEYHGMQSIKDSIPLYDSSILSIEVMKEELQSEKFEEDYLDMDDILDKIAVKGIDSLSEREKEFLDQKSKEM